MISINEIMVGNMFNEGTVLEVRQSGVVTVIHHESRPINSSLLGNMLAVPVETIVTYDKLTPIELQFDILDDFGFKNSRNQHKQGLQLLLFEGYVSLRLVFNKFPLVLEIDNSRMPLHEINYYHQLQNFINNFKSKQ